MARKKVVKTEVQPVSAKIKAKTIKLPKNVAFSGWGTPVKVTPKVYSFVIQHLWSELEEEWTAEELVQLGEVIFLDKHGYATYVITAGKNSTRIARYE